MSAIKHLISSLSELYKKTLRTESVEFSTDFYLDVLAEQAEANKKRIADLGFWDKQGNYIEDYQEIDKNESIDSV